MLRDISKLDPALALLIIDFFWESTAKDDPAYDIQNFEKKNIALNRNNVVLYESDMSGLFWFEPVDYNQAIIYRIHVRFLRERRGILFKRSLQQALNFLKTEKKAQFIEAAIPQKNRSARYMAASCGFNYAFEYINPAHGENIKVYYKEL